MQSILPSSATECCHLRRSPMVCKSHPRRRRAVGLGRCPVRARGSKVRFVDKPPETSPRLSVQRSMSSIKRDVKKKVSPSTGRREDFCLEIQPTACEGAPRFTREGSSGLVCHFHGFHLPVATTPIES